MKFVIPPEILSHFGPEKDLGNGLKGCPVIKNLPYDTFTQLRDVDHMLENVNGKWHYVTEDPQQDDAGEEEPAESEQDSELIQKQEASDTDLAAILNDPFLCGSHND